MDDLFRYIITVPGYKNELPQQYINRIDQGIVRVTELANSFEVDVRYKEEKTSKTSSVEYKLIAFATDQNDWGYHGWKEQCSVQWEERLPRNFVFFPPGLPRHGLSNADQYEIAKDLFYIVPYCEECGEETCVDFHKTNQKKCSLFLSKQGKLKVVGGGCIWRYRRDHFARHIIRAFYLETFKKSIPKFETLDFCKAAYVYFMQGNQWKSTGASAKDISRRTEFSGHFKPTPEGSHLLKGFSFEELRNYWSSEHKNKPRSLFLSNVDLNFDSYRPKLGMLVWAVRKYHESSFPSEVDKK